VRIIVINVAYIAIAKLEGIMENEPNKFDSIKLDGMSVAAAKEYIFGLIATLKLTEKDIHSLEEEAAKWKGRVELARSAGKNDLASEAEKEARKAGEKLAGLRDEEASLRDQIETIRKKLPGLAARERSVDPDLLEQELLMALGKTGEEAETDRAFEKLEKESNADSALQALKEKLKGNAD
jgi:phage shock protein A